MFTETRKSHGFHRNQLSKKLKERKWKKQSLNRSQNWQPHVVIDEWWWWSISKTNPSECLSRSVIERSDGPGNSFNALNFHTQLINWWRRRRRRRREKSTKLSFHVRRILSLIKSDSIQCIEWEIRWMCAVVSGVRVLLNLEFHQISHFVRNCSFRIAHSYHAKQYNTAEYIPKFVMNGLWCVRSHSYMC